MADPRSSSSNGRRVVVTGASGFVARHLRRHLLDRGITPVSISRGDFEALDGEVKIVSGGYDGRRIAPGLRGADALVHLAGIGRQSADADYDSVNAGLTGRLMGLCRRAGVRKVVYASGLGVSEDPALGYFISKLRAERLVAGSGMDYTVFRPSYIVGGGDPLTAHLRGQALRGAVAVPGSGSYVIQPVYIGDAVDVIRRSITGAGFRNRIVDLVGPETITFGEYVGLFSRATGAAVTRIGLEEAYRAAITGGSGGDGHVPFGVDDLNILVGGFVGDHDTLQRISGTGFRPVTGLFESGLLP